MYTVYGSSRNRAFRVMWMLEELGQPYEVSPVKPQSPEARVVNPTGKVPALKDGDLIVTDSVAILTYLAEKHNALSPAPGSAEKARMLSALFLILDDIEGALWLNAKHKFALPEAVRLGDAVRPAVEFEFARGMAALASHLGDKTWLAGDMFTYADIVAGHVMGWAVVSKLAPPETGPIADYIARVRARPAYAAAVARGKEMES